MRYQLCGSSGFRMKAEDEAHDTDWSSELDNVPFVHRLKLLKTTKRTSLSANSEPASHLNVIDKEDKHCDSQGVSSIPSTVSPANKKMGQQTVQPQSYETNISLGVDSVDAYDKFHMDNVVVDNCLQNGTSHPELAMSEVCNGHDAKVNTKILPDQRSVGCSIIGSVGDDVQALKLESSISNEFVEYLDHMVLKERLRMLLSRKISVTGNPIAEGKPLGLSSCGPLDNMSTSTSHTSDSTLLTLVKVKAEPLDNNTMHGLGMDAIKNFSFDKVHVKSEPDFVHELSGDKNVDMRLGDRMKLRTVDSELNTPGNFEGLPKVLPSSFENGHGFIEASNTIKINRPRKRKKTATDSIETALDEDAPGLLQVLVEKGVSIDEIKLYGETDSDEPIDESFTENGFADLESVISKIFHQRDSLLKFAPFRCTKGSKPSYCLPCLFSLVEQTRYLRFRNWPAEWGWCRDLQSFIFVFEKHNRIVLERPEYGYATYFFELVDSVSINWQIKRLVTSMKLTNCGRIMLIENKTLLVGEDISEGEAEVLMQYGWTPNSGLGTMLNYCDRVVHDRKNEEREISEWRSKIGKLLMAGYNGGSIISSTIPAKAVDDESPEIKVEL
ncbi:uncharacterized protein [Euphorbia lathyris]|uniref:uncharacterized protein isoform X2 n=1 Tax=Euphorbia lathyris TaxID=212925 RepID=UPI0033137F6B